MPIASPQQLNDADRLLVLQSMIPRVMAACIKYALYIIGEDPGTSNHANRLNWAKGVIDSPQSTAETMSKYLLNQDTFLNGGSSIVDDDLQGIIETAANADYIEPLPQS